MRSIHVVALGLVLCAGVPPAAQAEIPQKIKIGVLSDIAGPVSDVAGTGSVVAARLAVEEYAKSILGNVEVEVIQ